MNPLSDETLFAEALKLPPAEREWILRLAEFESIGDLTASWGNGRFQQLRFRDTCFLHCAYASLLAVEGRGDEALAVLQPMLAVSRKLRPAARTLVRYWTGVSCQQMCQNAADFILQVPGASGEAVRSFAAALVPADNLPADYQRVFLCECALNVLAYSAPSNQFRSAVGVALRLFYLPNATDNLATRYYRALVEVAQEGRGEGIRIHDAGRTTCVKSPRL